jgi:TRAP-type transport system small permease protein
MARFFILFCDKITIAAKYLIGACIGVIVLITLAAVWWRYVLDNPLSWVEQISNMIFIWVVFIGSAVLYRQNLHIGVDFFLNMLGERQQEIWKWFVEFINLSFIIILFIYSLKLTIDVIPNTMGSLDLSPAYYYVACPVSCFMMLLYFIEKIVDPRRRVPDGIAGEF